MVRVSEILKKYFAPEAADSIYLEVVRVLQYRRAAQSIGEYIAEYELLRCREAPKVNLREDLPEPLAPPCACRSRRRRADRKSSAPARILKIPRLSDVASTIRRLL